jgi:hypothetical protein
MSITDQFWEYAREAILSASEAKTDQDKESLLELARTWTQVALEQRAPAPSLQVDNLAAGNRTRIN